MVGHHPDVRKWISEVFRNWSSAVPIEQDQTFAVAMTEKIAAHGELAPGTSVQNCSAHLEAALTTERRDPLDVNGRVYLWLLSGHFLRMEQ